MTPGSCTQEQLELILRSDLFSQFSYNQEKTQVCLQPY